jgi:hypothetical protein
MKVVETPAELIRAIWGSETEAARWAGYRDERGVYNWRHRGVPPSFHLRTALEAKRRGVVFDPRVLGLEDQHITDFVNLMGWGEIFDAHV